MKKELKIGIFVLLSILAIVLLFVGSSISLNNSNFNKYHAQFYNIAGLKANSSVVLSGVEVGSVENVYLDEKNIAHADFIIKKSVKVTANSYVQVVPNTILGNPILVLNIPNFNDTVSSSDTIQSAPSISVSQSLQDISFVAKNIKDTTAGIKDTFSAIKDAPKDTFNKISDIINMLSH